MSDGISLVGWKLNRTFIKISSQMLLIWHITKVAPLLLCCFPELPQFFLRMALDLTYMSSRVLISWKYLFRVCTCSSEYLSVVIWSGDAGLSPVNICKSLIIFSARVHSISDSTWRCSPSMMHLQMQND